MKDDALYEEIVRHAKRICIGIRSRRARGMAENEIIDHLLCAVYDKALRGIPQEQALSEAIAEFGECGTLKQQYARIHNRLPPDFWPSVGRFCLRAAGAALLSAVLWGMVEAGNDEFEWYHLIPGALVLCGLWPFRVLCLTLSRLRVHSRLRRLCRQGRCEALILPSLPVALFGPGSAVRYVLRVDGRIHFIRVLYAPHRTALRFLDETSIAWVTRRGGIGLIDRAPRQFNSTKTATFISDTVHPADFSFLLPDAWRNMGTPIDKLLLIDPFPPAVSFVQGNTLEEVRPGESVFDFVIHNRRSLLAYLEEKV